MFRQYDLQQQSQQRPPPMMAPAMMPMQLPVVQQQQQAQPQGEGYSWNQIKGGFNTVKQTLGIGKQAPDQGWRRHLSGADWSGGAAAEGSPEAAGHSFSNASHDAAFGTVGGAVRPMNTEQGNGNGIFGA